MFITKGKQVLVMVIPGTDNTFWNKHNRVVSDEYGNTGDGKVEYKVDHS